VIDAQEGGEKGDLVHWQLPTYRESQTVYLMFMWSLGQFPLWKNRWLFSSILRGPWSYYRRQFDLSLYLEFDQTTGPVASIWTVN